jgi:hypothetical protein
MIETAVRVQLQEMGSIVAVIAFGAGRYVKFGLADCGDAVMAFTAFSEYIPMIDKRCRIEAQR